MAENEIFAADSVEDSDGKRSKPRSPRTIRFSDSEWTCIEKEAKARGMNAAELVRHAAVNFAMGRLAADSSLFPREIAAQIERIYRGVYLLSTLKRDEMVRDGQRDMFDKVSMGAQESQNAIIQEASRTAL